MQKRFLIGVGILLVFLFAIGLRMVNDSLGEKNILSRFFFSQVSPGPGEALYFVSPSGGAHEVSNTFQVELRIGSSEGITSMKAYLNYNPSLIAVVSMVSSSSAFSTWWEDTFDNVAGKLRFQASTPTPGFSGNNGLIATITFQAMGGGTATLTYDSSSLTLKANDTNILNLAGSTSGSYTITVPPSPPPSPPPTPPLGGGGGGATPPSPPPSSTRLRGDCSADGKVNIFDLSILLSNWQRTTGTCDLSGDGVVNIFDLSILLSNWAP